VTASIGWAVTFAGGWTRIEFLSNGLNNHKEDSTDECSEDVTGKINGGHRVKGLWLFVRKLQKYLKEIIYQSPVQQSKKSPAGCRLYKRKQ
jgi:hypothetical protein